MTKTRTIAALNVLFLLTLSVSARAQESLQAAKDLYASAAYEDSLGMLSRLQLPDAPAEVQQYRAFCLIALGRLPEAEKAIESVVKANPEFVPAALEVSPRIQEIFTRTRNQLLPDLVRDMYLVAKQSLERKDRAESVSGFKAVVELIDGAGPDAREALDEMRFLAAGFLDLSRALPEPGVTRPPTAAVPVQSASASASSGLSPSAPARPQTRRPWRSRRQWPSVRRCRRGRPPTMPAAERRIPARSGSASPSPGRSSAPKSSAPSILCTTASCCRPQRTGPISQPDDLGQQSHPSRSSRSNSSRISSLLAPIEGRSHSA